MQTALRRRLSCALLACLAAGLSLALSACGGGGSSTTTTYSGGGLNSQGLSAAVSLPFVQTTNNLPVTVEPKIGNAFSTSINTNILYATVTVCVPGTNQCQTVDHVQVDTGSVGLRIMASKLSSLNLPAVVAWPARIRSGSVINS